MSTTFTPGPWTQHESVRDCVTFIGRHGEENLFLENADGYFACQNESDAALIAAAPDLYEALKEMLEYAGIIEERCDSVATNKARAAIAKAEGEA